MNIFTALKDIGSTSEEVAKYLHNLGIKGRLRSCRQCPILMYLKEVTGWSYRMTNNYEIFDYDPRVPTPYLYKAVREFMADFDKGKYPELVY